MSTSVILTTKSKFLVHKETLDELYANQLNAYEQEDIDFQEEEDDDVNININNTPSKKPTFNSISNQINLYMRNETETLTGSEINISWDSSIKMAQTLSVLLFTCITFWFNKAISGYAIIGWLMVSFFSKFFITFIYLYASVTKMRSIQIIKGKINGFGHISFPMQIDYHPSRVVTSISELASIRASNVHLVLYDMLTHCGLLFFCAIGFKWHEIYQQNDHWTWSNNQHMSLLFALCAAFGMFMVAVWELNMFSKIHVVMHYVGGFGLVMIAVATIYQHNFSVISIVLCAVDVVLFAIWFCAANFYFDEQYKNDPKKVHKVSMICITLETVAWFLLSFLIVSFVFHLD
eukprot:395990_1